MNTVVSGTLSLGPKPFDLLMSPWGRTPTSLVGTPWLSNPVTSEKNNRLRIYQKYWPDVASHIVSYDVTCQQVCQ